MDTLNKPTFNPPGASVIRCHKSNFLSVIGDQTYRVKLTVKDYKHPPEKGRGFYTHELTEIALPDVKRVVAHSEEPMPTPPPGNTITVHDLLTGASRNDGTKSKGSTLET